VTDQQPATIRFKDGPTLALAGWSADEYTRRDRPPHVQITGWLTAQGLAHADAISGYHRMLGAELPGREGYGGAFVPAVSTRPRCRGPPTYGSPPPTRPPSTRSSRSSARTSPDTRAPDPAYPEAD
jgi:hypothetical protein